MFKLKNTQKKKVLLDYIDGHYSIIDNRGSIQETSSFWEDMKDVVKDYQRQGYYVMITDSVRTMAFL